VGLQIFIRAFAHRAAVVASPTCALEQKAASPMEDKPRAPNTHFDIGSRHNDYF